MPEATLPMTSQSDAAGPLRLSSAIRERCEIPPTFSELRDFFVMLTQRHFSNSSDYGAHSAQMACMTYNLENPDKSELPVGAAFGDADQKANSRGVRVFLQDFTFRPSQIGMTTSYSPDNATIYTSKSAVGTLEIVVSHENAELAYMLAESLVPFLEGSRMIWMELFHITSFNTVGLGSVRKTIPVPTPIYQAYVKAQIQCQVVTALTEESLRLKKIAFSANLI